MYRTLPSTPRKRPSIITHKYEACRAVSESCAYRYAGPYTCNDQNCSLCAMLMCWSAAALRPWLWCQHTQPQTHECPNDAWICGSRKRDQTVARCARTRKAVVECVCVLDDIYGWPRCVYTDSQSCWKSLGAFWCMWLWSVLLTLLFRWGISGNTCRVIASVVGFAGIHHRAISNVCNKLVRFFSSRWITIGSPNLSLAFELNMSLAFNKNSRYGIIIP